VLEIRKLTKRYSSNGDPAIDSVDFEVRDGEVVGFVGLNGAGKTTTIEIAGGVTLPTSGTVLVDGHDIVEDKVEASKLIGWVSEAPNFDPGVRAIDLLKYFAGFYDIPSYTVDALSIELLGRMGLSGAERKRFGDYSQGMKKRFALAAAFLTNPHNLLFDEVLNGLDPEGIHFFRSLVDQQRSEGRAVLLSSHILAEVEGLSDRVVFIHKGRLLKVATKAELAAFGGSSVKMVVDNPDSRLAASLVGSGDVRIEGSSVFISDFTGDRAELNSQLMKGGYRVSEFSVQKSSLEEYFLRLIREVS
jgi:ABC-2 type transport system ATP-binding protein